MLDSWSHMIDVFDLMACLSNEGKDLTVERYIDICNDMRIDSDAMGEIYLILKKNDILNFLDS